MTTPPRPPRTSAEGAALDEAWEALYEALVPMGPAVLGWTGLDGAVIAWHRPRIEAAVRAASPLDEAWRAAEAALPDDVPDADTALDYLADLGKLWRETSEEGRRALATATFARLGAIGPRIVSVEVTPYAERRGLVLALPTTATTVGGTGAPHRPVASWSLRIVNRDAWLRAARRSA